MRRRSMKFVLLVAGLLAGWVASAGGADLPSLPPVPPVQVPTLPVLPPAPPAPQLPAAPLPKVTPAPPVSQPALPVGGVSGGDSSSSNSGGGGTASPQTAPASPSESRPARVYRLRFSRDWISRTGPKKRRQTVLVFVLREAALVEFVVIQVAPDCRRVGRFRVVGRPGVNRVRFRGRIGRRALGPGTYRIMARALPRGRALVDTKLVVVAHPERDEISSGRRANACGSEPTGQSTASTAAASTPAKPTAATPPATPDKAKERPTPSRDKGVLGAKFTKRAVDAVKSIPLWLFALLGLAIAILAVAALPMRAAPSRQAALALAHHRGAFALTGAAVLLVVTLAYTMH